MNLFEIAKEYKQTLVNLSEIEDLPEDVIRDTMESLSGDLDTKGKAVIAYILNEAADIQTLKDHKATIDARIKVISNRVNGLREYLRVNMQACGIAEISSPLFSAKLRKPLKVVNVIDESKIPKQFLKTTVSVSKAEISKALKAGDEVSGAELVDGIHGITIK